MTLIKLMFVLLLMTPTIVADDSCPGLPTCFCNKDKTSVNCEGKHFNEIPTTIPSTVEKLYLSHNKITIVKTATFASLKNLQIIQLDFNLIDTIEPFAFENLTNVKSLDLRSNKLLSLGQNAFAGMPTLETLYFTTNKIRVVSKTSFTGANMLKSLYFQSNSLTVIPDLGFLPGLARLVLDGNEIERATFPDSYMNNTKLSYVVLSNNNIQSIDNDTFRALTNRSISALYLSRNKLTNTSSGVFSHFKSIASVKIGSNLQLGPNALKAAIESLQGKDMVSLDISDLPALRGGLLKDTFALLRNTPITTLNMRSIAITSLMDNVFFGLNKLLHLDLSSSKLQVTSNASFAGLDKLTILNLQKNRLTSIPCCLPTTLEQLYLEDNQITAVDKDIFYNLGQLKQLRLSFNGILTLMQDSFNGLSSLEYLDLYGNQIATLPGKVFQSLIRLKSLILAKNNLATIQQSTSRFTSLSSLIYLNMADNQCSYIQSDFFSQLTSLKYLRLQGNSLGDVLQQDFGGELLGNLKNLQELYLMNNHIHNLPAATFKHLGELYMLNVSSNKLTTWDKELFKSTSKLRVLDMSNNLIATLQTDTLHELPSSMVSLNLTGNRFNCDCNLRDFRDWINETKIILTNNASYMCSDPKDWNGKTVLSFNRKKINCLFFTWWEIVLACAVAVVLVAILCCALYKKRWHIKLFFYKLRRSSQKRRVRAADGHGNYGAIAEGPEFDAYISCSREDYDWVMENLLPGIDNGQRADDDHVYGGDFTLYFEPRNAQPGVREIECIYENMCASRHVIIGLSRNYLSQPLKRFELDVATELMYDGKITGIIVVDIADGLPNKKLPKYITHTMKRNKVLEWSNNPEAKELVKRRIIETLRMDMEPAADKDSE